MPDPTTARKPNGVRRARAARERLATPPDPAPAAAKASAAAAMSALPADAQVDVTKATLQAMPAAEQNAVLRSLSPDQKATNDIWRWTVMTFAIVLVAVTIGVIGAVIVSFWQEVDTMLVQVLLTLFTTAAGTLAGFVSGRASAPRPTG